MFKKILPDDIFLSVMKNYAAPEEELWKGTVDPRRPGRHLSGNEVIDAAVDLMYKNRHNSGENYAAWLGFPIRDLNGFFRIMTGMTFVEWNDQFLLLMAKELLDKSNLSSSEIAKWMHFTTVNVFGRWFRHLSGRQPIEWRIEVRSGLKGRKYHSDD